MQTVNFNCPHCGNLMAVGSNLLGRNVRCPHCKQVVRAPAASGEAAIAAAAAPVMTPPPPSPPAPIYIPKPQEAAESIFGDAPPDEDLFGTVAPKPSFPAPPPPPEPYRPALQETVTVGPVAEERQSFEIDVSPPEHQPLPEIEPLPEMDARPTPRMRPSRTEDAPEVERAPATERDQPPYRSKQEPKEGGGSTGAFAWILLGYGAIVTILAVFFAYHYFSGGSSKHPFEEIPDVYGQYDKANRKSTSFKGLPNARAEVPPHLRVKLGGELTIGDLWVSPQAVERKVLAIKSKKDDEQEDTLNTAKETLVLRMKVRNLSTDTSFHPNDPAFNRGVAKNDGMMPYTALQVRNEFHYGAIPWPETAGARERYVEGLGQTRDAAPLGPGQEGEVFVCVSPPSLRTDISDFGKTLKLLEPGEKCLWRVQLRRGLVKFKANDQDVEMSCTAVIGVEFNGRDITR